MAKPRKAARSKHEEDELKRRAFAGYWRFARMGQPVALFDETRADVVEVRGKLYVTLRAAGSALLCSASATTASSSAWSVSPHELKRDE